jgi:hypothetical protein
MSNAPRKRRNLFYVLLVPVGVAFVVTAFAYGLMAFQAVNATHARASASESQAAAPPHALTQWLRANGDRALLGELAVLAALTVGALGVDLVQSSGPSQRDRAAP